MSDLKNRLFVIFILLPLVLILLYINIFYYIQIFFLMLILSFFVSYELINLFKNIEINISQKLIFSELILFYTLTFLYLKFFYKLNIFKINISDFLSFLFLIFFIIFIVHSIINVFSKNIKKAFLNFQISNFIFIFSFLTPILIYYFYTNYEQPFYYIIYFLTIVWSSNSFAYLVGMSFKKRHVVGLKVSPNKSYEGYIGALILGTIIPYIIWKLLLNKYINLLNFESIIIIIVINLFTMVGDLFESLIKRFCNSKDSSNLFKGHGGILDMVDSIMFSFPIFYLLIRFIL